MPEQPPGTVSLQAILDAFAPMLAQQSAKQPKFPNQDPSGHWVVYKFYDQRNRLLYVGLTNCTERRFNEHAKTKFWWSDVQDIELLRFASRAQARIHERHIIALSAPIHNKQDNLARRLDPDRSPLSRYSLEHDAREVLQALEGAAATADQELMARALDLQRAFVERVSQ